MPRVESYDQLMVDEDDYLRDRRGWYICYTDGSCKGFGLELSARKMSEGSSATLSRIMLALAERFRAKIRKSSTRDSFQWIRSAFWRRHRNHSTLPFLWSESEHKSTCRAESRIIGDSVCFTYDFYVHHWFTFNYKIYEILSHAKKYDLDRLQIRTDSQFLIDMIPHRSYGGNLASHLATIVDEIVDLMDYVEVKFVHVPAHRNEYGNERADYLGF